MEIRAVTTIQDLLKVESLSWEIIHEHYDDYIDPDHVEFYLNKYQTVAALQQQMKLNHFHYLIMINRSFVGFLTLQLMDDSLRLSKLYVHKSARDYGVGNSAMDFVENEAEKHERRIVDLIVNRKNLNGIRFYERMGYVITEELVHHFENGHSEEDYLMHKKLK
jgi:diamine N-acetyltransferase